MQPQPLRLASGGAPLAAGQGPLQQVLHNASLYPVFQPIVNLADASIHAHEALIRGAAGTPLHTPDCLLRAAAEEDLGFEFESACVVATLRHWGHMRSGGRLFVNISANALVRVFNLRGREGLLRWILDLRVMPRTLVLEITEHERVDNMDRLAEVVQEIRSAGVSLALDDFGDGHSSLRLWSQLKPEIVKIDKYFTRNISAHGDKLKTIQALQQIATIFGSSLVAEGIETAEDLRVLRDLGIEYGQGYFLGHPDRKPLKYLGVDPQRVLGERQVAVFPELGRMSQGGHLRSLSLLRAPTVVPETHNDTLAEIFLEHPTLHAVAMLEGERPVGIINRALFMNEYSKLYYREVWGRKPCGIHANLEPRLIERERLGAIDDVGAAVVGRCPCFPGRADQRLPQGRAEGLGETDVGHNPVAEEGVDPLGGAVDELVGDEQVAGGDLFFEAADGVDGDDMFDPKRFESPDVGPHRYLGGHDAVAAAVARQEGDPDAAQNPGDDGIAWFAVRGVDVHLANIGESFDVVEAGAADDGDLGGGVGHVMSFPFE